MLQPPTYCELLPMTMRNIFVYYNTVRPKEINRVNHDYHGSVGSASLNAAGFDNCRSCLTTAIFKLALSTAP
jgi:hypothetical protein